MKHQTQFILTGGKVAFTDSTGRKWRMRQPTPEEASDGDSAYRIAYNRVMKDSRLRDLAGGDRAELEREARVRASAAEVVYMLPLLLENPETGRPAFDVFDPESLAEFERLTVISEMSKIYFGDIRGALNEAKKKSIPPSSSASPSAVPSEGGPSPAARKR